MIKRSFPSVRALANEEYYTKPRSQQKKDEFAKKRFHVIKNEPVSEGGGVVPSLRDRYCCSSCPKWSNATLERC